MKHRTKYADQLVAAVKSRNVGKLFESINVMTTECSLQDCSDIVLMAMDFAVEHHHQDAQWAGQYLPKFINFGFRTHVNTRLFQLLVKEGFVPGADFGLIDTVLYMSKPASDMLNAKLPEELMQYSPAWSTNAGKTPDGSYATARTPEKYLADELGVDFMAKLQEVVTKRLTKLTDGQALHYLSEMCNRVTRRTSIDLAEYMALSWIQPVRFTAIAQAKPERVDCWMVDLVWAAGGAKTLRREPSGEVWLSDESFDVLSRVSASGKL